LRKTNIQVQPKPQQTNAADHKKQVSVVKLTKTDHNVNSTGLGGRLWFVILTSPQWCESDHDFISQISQSHLCAIRTFQEKKTNRRTDPIVTDDLMKQVTTFSNTHRKPTRCSS